MKQLPKVRALIEALKTRPGVYVEAGEAWLVRVPKDDLVCEITIPIDWCFEWFVSVRGGPKKGEVWSD